MSTAEQLRGSSEKTVSRNKISEQQMQQEFHYQIAQKLTRRLLGQELITLDEFHKISLLNRKSFSPYLAELMEE